MEFRVKVRRARRTWLESVETDMAELEIDKEDVHDRKIWRRKSDLSENGLYTNNNNTITHTNPLNLYSFLGNFFNNKKYYLEIHTRKLAIHPIS